MKYLKILCQLIKEPTYFLKDLYKKSWCNFLHLLIHYFLIPDVGRGPSAKFQVENVHTAAELKMTGNCLKASRPFLSFDMAFADKDKPHLQLLKELFIQTFGIAKGHPKSQPFFDRVYTFSLIDDKIWFRHYQILPDEDGSLAEIGPRFVLNPIKIFAASFSG